MGRVMCSLKLSIGLIILDLMAGHCDSPRRSRPHLRHPGSEPEDSPAPGFRLWSSGPNFDTELPQDVTGLVGQTAYLTCRVFERTNKTISWIRHSDLHILTVGRYTYTADSRYQSIYNPTTDEWILQIKYLQERDSGMYECQVSTEPVRSFFVRLNIVDEIPSPVAAIQSDEQVGRAELLSGPEVHVERGSTLNLTCVVLHTGEKPHYLLWYHSNQTIDYTSPRGGVSVVNSDTNLPQVSSTLLVYQVTELDSGKYSCRPSNTEIVSTMVYVIKDEHQEKLKSLSNAGRSDSLSGPLLLLLLLFLLLLLLPPH